MQEAEGYESPQLISIITYRYPFIYLFLHQGNLHEC